MFKLIKNLFLIFLCIFSYFWVKKEKIIEQWLSSNLKTTVTIGRASLGLSSLKIRNLRIHNAISNEKLPYMMDVEQVLVRFSLPTMLLSKKIEISEIMVKGSTLSLFSYSQDQKSNNLSLFLIHLEENSSRQTSVSYTPQEPYLLYQKPFPIFIKRCLFFSTRCCSALAPNKDFTIQALPSMEFLGKVNPYPDPAQAIKSLLCLAIEESCLHMGVKMSPSHNLLQQSLTFFSSNSHLLNTLTKKSKTIAPSQNDIPNILKDLLIR